LARNAVPLSLRKASIKPSIWVSTRPPNAVEFDLPTHSSDQLASAKEFAFLERDGLRNSPPGPHAQRSSFDRPFRLRSAAGRSTGAMAFTH
jgi:hypothetical protein